MCQNYIILQGQILHVTNHVAGTIFFTFEKTNLFFLKQRKTQIYYFPLMNKLKN